MHAHLPRTTCHTTLEHDIVRIQASLASLVSEASELVLVGLDGEPGDTLSKAVNTERLTSFPMHVQRANKPIIESVRNRKNLREEMAGRRKVCGECRVGR